MSEPIRWRVDAYQEWVERERLPVVTGLSADLHRVETAPWPRMGGRGAFIHLDARGDYCNYHVYDLDTGVRSEVRRHLFEEIIYVLEGHGATEVETSAGPQRFEWGTGSVFSLPINTRHRFVNDGSVRARLAAATDLPLTMKVFRNERFIFGTEFEFSERGRRPETYRGEGRLILVRDHRHMWETGLVGDLRSFDKLQDSPSRGQESLNVMLVLADSTLNAGVSEIGPASYKKAHRHEDGTVILQLSGRGYTTYWEEDGRSRGRVDWHHGVLHGPPDRLWHQHFNVSDEPARYLAVTFGSLRYPVTRERLSLIDHSWAQRSSWQIEYEDEDPRIRAGFETERAQRERDRAVERQAGR